MAKDIQETRIRRLLAELPELLADYEHLAPDADGKIDPMRRKRLKRFRELLFKIETSQSVK